jgi:hypothetical protein
MGQGSGVFFSSGVSKFKELVVDVEAVETGENHTTD